MPRWLLAMGGEDSSGGGAGADPTVVAGPYAISPADSFPLPLYLYPLDLTANQRVTLGVAFDCWSVVDTGDSGVIEFILDVQCDASGALSVVGAAPIPTRSPETGIAFTASVAIVGANLVCSVTDATGAVASGWLVSVWRRTLVATTQTPSFAPGQWPTPDTEPPVLDAFSAPATSGSTVMFSVPPHATDNIGVAGYCVTVNDPASPAANQFVSPSPSSVQVLVNGIATLRAWAIDLAGNIGGPLLQQTDVTVSTVYFADAFNRANAADAGNGWTGHQGGVAGISANQMIRSDNVGYAKVYNAGGGALPADYYVSWTVPDVLLDRAFWGFFGRGDPGTNTHVSVFWSTGGRHVYHVGDGVGINTNGDASFVVTNDFPASWDLNQRHQVALQFTATNVHFFADGQEVGYFPNVVNRVAGLTAGNIGEGLDALWDDFMVSDYLPSFTP